MSDLVEKLRSEQQRLKIYGYRVSGIICEAADRIEQLERENQRQIELRKYAVRQIEHESLKRASAEQERDELAAHVERINRALDEEGETIELEYCPDQFQIDNELLETVLSESPQTSLAEVKAKQAEYSYRCGAREFCSINSTVSSVEIATHQHAQKIREGKDGE